MRDKGFEMVNERRSRVYSYSIRSVVDKNIPITVLNRGKVWASAMPSKRKAGGLSNDYEEGAGVTRGSGARRTGAPQIGGGAVEGSTHGSRYEHGGIGT